MSRRQPRPEVRDLVRRAQSLSAEQNGVIMSVLLGNALLGSAFQVAVLVSLVRLARRAYRVRRLGARAVANVVVAPPEVVLMGSYAVYRIGTRVLLPRWVERRVRRAEADRAAD